MKANDPDVSASTPRPIARPPISCRVGTRSATFMSRFLCIAAGASFLLFASSAAQAGIWDKAAEIAVSEAAAEMGVTAEEVIGRFVSNPEAQKSILATMEKLGLRAKAPQLFQPNASALLGSQIRSWSLDNSRFGAARLSGLNTAHLLDGGLGTGSDSLGTIKLPGSTGSRLIGQDSAPPLVNHNWDFSKMTVKCGTQGAGVTGVDAASTGEIRPEVGLAWTAGCSGVQALRYRGGLGMASESLANPQKLDPQVIKNFLSASPPQ